MKFERKDLLDLESLSPDEINLILDTAKSFHEILERPIKKVPTLRGKTIANLFFEPSTRTKLSFELSAKRLNADLISFSSSTSSVLKGEGLIDTAKNIISMKVDALVLRHPSAGAAHILAHELPISVINAGDGAHEHPTQGLLDLYSIKQKKATLAGLNVAIIGDIAHSRVARSDIWGLTKLGAKVKVCGPPTFMPKDIEKMGVQVTYFIEEALLECDVVIMLRVQRERQKSSLISTIEEYREFFALSEEKLKLAKPDAIIMHPGPVNWGVELPVSLVDSAQNIILDQVTNGIAVRMAVMYLLLT